MRPFDPPANGNLRAEAAPSLASHEWTTAAVLTWIDLSLWPWRYVADLQLAAWSALLGARAETAPPALVCAAADVRDANSALLQAQTEMLDSLRRSP